MPGWLHCSSLLLAQASLPQLKPSHLVPVLAWGPVLAPVGQAVILSLRVLMFIGGPLTARACCLVPFCRLPQTSANWRVLQRPLSLDTTASPWLPLSRTGSTFSGSLTANPEGALTAKMTSSVTCGKYGSNKSMIVIPGTSSLPHASPFTSCSIKTEAYISLHLFGT